MQISSSAFHGYNALLWARDNPITSSPTSLLSSTLPSVAVGAGDSFAARIASLVASRNASLFGLPTKARGQEIERHSGKSDQNRSIAHAKTSLHPKAADPVLSVAQGFRPDHAKAETSPKPEAPLPEKLDGGKGVKAVDDSPLKSEPKAVINASETSAALATTASAPTAETLVEAVVALRPEVAVVPAPTTPKLSSPVTPVPTPVTEPKPVSVTAVVLTPTPTTIVSEQGSTVGGTAKVTGPKNDTAVAVTASKAEDSKGDKADKLDSKPPTASVDHAKKAYGSSKM